MKNIFTLLFAVLITAHVFAQAPVGTVDSTNSIGTTDNIPLNIMFNNQNARINREDYNTFFGKKAGNLNTTGNANTAFGNFALKNNTKGNSNTAIGTISLRSNTTGDFNTAYGNSSLRGNTTGSYNTALGNSALISNIEGNFNVAIGENALCYNTTGSNNIAIGNNASTSVDNLFNSTAIGSNASVSASNSMVFGNHLVFGWGFGTEATTAAIRVGSNTTNGNGAILTKAGVWTNASDSTKKHDIKNISYGLKEVMKLNPVMYKMNGSNYQDIGFLAQEVKLILPEIIYGEEGEMTMSYGQMTSVLTKAMQELNERLKKENEDLKSEISNLKSNHNTRIEKLELIFNAEAKK